MTSRYSSTKPIWPLSLFLVFILAFITPLQAAKLYKWVDEDGIIRYSDRLTVEQSKQRHQTLTPEGRVLETKEKQKTPEELRQERAEAKRLEEEVRIKAEKLAKIQAEKDHHDRVLMMTFTSENEILEAQDERVAVIDSVIKLLKKNIQKEEEKLERLEQRAQTQFIDKDKAVPGGLAQNIEYFGEKILNKQKQLELKVEEKARVKQQYANDLIRYRELTEQAKAAQQQ